MFLRELMVLTMYSSRRKDEVDNGPVVVVAEAGLEARSQASGRDRRSGRATAGGDGDGDGERTQGTVREAALTAARAMQRDVFVFCVWVCVCDAGQGSSCSSSGDQE